MTVLTIAILFPRDTVAAGDEANGPALVRRARQRGIEASSVVVSRPQDMASADIYLLGGDGLAGAGDLVTHLRSTSAVDDVRAGRSILFAVDAGLAAVGRTWTDADGTTHPGLGLVGIDTRSAKLAARTVVTRPAPSLGLPTMIGWTSGGATVTSDPGVAPLAELDGEPPAADGVLAEGVIGTLLHGPVLALNPELADLVLARALGVTGWEPLPIPSIETARARRIAELARQQDRSPGTAGAPRRLRLPGAAARSDNRRGDAAPRQLGGDGGQEA
jgi:CobQ-like glutamine amidotransferase family enzyme